MASSASPLYRPVRHDGSRDFNVRLPDINEAIVLRLPYEVTLGPPSIISTSAVTNANGSSYHLCFVSGRVVHREPNSIQLDVWVCLGFSSAVPSSTASSGRFPLSGRNVYCRFPMLNHPRSFRCRPLLALVNHSNSVVSWRGNRVISTSG